MINKESHESSLFFIYGTLKNSMKNNGVLKKINGTFVSVAETKQKYPMFDLGNGFPYIQNSKGKGNIIQGEIWEVPKESIQILDDFEGVPTLYKKGVIDAEFENLSFDKLNCYFITDELDSGELDQVDFFDEWVEETTSFDYKAYYKKMYNQ